MIDRGLFGHARPANREERRRELVTLDGHTILDEERAWAQIAADVLGDEPELVSVSRFIPDSRVYRLGARAAKIRSRKTDFPAGLNGLEEQARLLRTTGLDVEYWCRGPWEVMTMPWREGDSLISASRRASFLERVRLGRALLRELARLHRADLAHGDLRPENIIVGADGIGLLDFDRAVTGRGFKLWWEELRSRSAPKPSTYPLWRLLLLLLLPGLRKARCRVQTRLLERAARKPRVTPPKPPERAPQVQPEDDVALLRRAWHLATLSGAHATGDPTAYYSFTYKGVHFSGDRPWYLRWEPIRRGVDFGNKRLVELGCNMGLLSSFAMIHGAAAAVGVDYDHQIVESAKLVARALGSGAEFLELDLSANVPWEDRVGTADIVTALSLIYWLPPAVQERTLRFLGRHREVLYEGHDPPEIEVARLKRAGFADVRVLGRTERERVLLHGLR